MKITHLILITFLSVTLSVSSYAEKPLYLDILIGQAQQKEDIDGIPEIKGQELSIGIRLGYRILDQLAIELGYHDFGEDTDPIAINGFVLNETIETTSFNLGFKGIFPVSERIDLNARLGAFRWDYRFDEVSAFGRFKSDDNGIDIYYGVGAFFQMTDFLGIGLEFTVLDHEAEINGFDFDREVRNASFIVSYGL